MNLLIILSTYISMEAATWTIHKYVMHGFLWFLHRDHHDHSTKGAFEKNDWFFVIFATPAILLIYLGVSTVYSQLLYIGIGITMYGFSYFFVHDIFIHQRLKVLQQTKNPYLKAIRRAHKQHHKHISKENGECFGFLWVPIKYFKLYLK
ncbi:MAG: sterol desaturase family protein [Saprospiraceae bacterium]|nr:sterol desaturase family protein [Saprospiraceae bacterium]MBK8153684.1 sterol desaturase family protein [Saprospiraceae bacterium]MBL0261921.1 sterol desaturase family protein [Saprospiraceae bacterium]